MPACLPAERHILARAARPLVLHAPAAHDGPLQPEHSLLKGLLGAQLSPEVCHGLALDGEGGAQAAGGGVQPPQILGDHMWEDSTGEIDDLQYQDLSSGYQLENSHNYQGARSHEVLVSQICSCDACWKPTE